MSRLIESWEQITAILGNGEGKVPVTPTSRIQAIESVLAQYRDGLIDDREADLYLDLFGDGFVPAIIEGESGQRAICWGIPDDPAMQKNWIELGKFLHRMVRGFTGS